MDLKWRKCIKTFPSTYRRLRPLLWMFFIELVPRCPIWVRVGTNYAGYSYWTPTRNWMRRNGKPSSSEGGTIWPNNRNSPVNGEWEIVPSLLKCLLDGEVWSTSAWRRASFIWNDWGPALVWLCDKKRCLLALLHCRRDENHQAFPLGVSVRANRDYSDIFLTHIFLRNDRGVPVAFRCNRSSSDIVVNFYQATDLITEKLKQKHVCWDKIILSLRFIVYFYTFYNFMQFIIIIWIVWNWQTFWDFRFC